VFLAGKNGKKIWFSFALPGGTHHGKAHCDLDFHLRLTREVVRHVWRERKRKNHSKNSKRQLNVFTFDVRPAGIIDESIVDPRPFSRGTRFYRARRFRKCFVKNKRAKNLLTMAIEFLTLIGRMS